MTARRRSSALVVGLVAGLVVALAGCKSDEKRPVGHVEPPADGTSVTDPVNRESCEKTPMTPVAVYEMRNYYFCCTDCPAKFVADPKRYADAATE